jgi:hypothetical protein
LLCGQNLVQFETVIVVILSLISQFPFLSVEAIGLNTPNQSNQNQINN